jgi:hypothetical protein
MHPRVSEADRYNNSFGDIMIDQFHTKYNSDDKINFKMIDSPLSVEGGKAVIERLLHLFNVRNKVELSEIIGVSTGSIATWQTRDTVPYELLIRIHLATGVSMQYLLFDEAENNVNVMQYCEDPSTLPSYASINQNIKSFHYSLSQPIHCDGGLQIINRLMQVLNIESKAELGRLCAINIGTIATWQTRKTIPHELLCRIHLATGVSMHYLCFGKEWESEPGAEKLNNSSNVDHFLPKNAVTTLPDNCWVSLNSFYIENGKKNKTDPYLFSLKFLGDMGIEGKNIEVISNKSATYFIDTSLLNVTKGEYLFSINGLYQTGELRQMPDGNAYLIEGDDKYPIDLNATKIHGTVVYILKKT